MSRRTGGFTLIEIMVVILVMGLLITLVLTHGPAHSDTLSLRAASGDLVQSLRLARSEAIADDRTIEFVAEPGHQRYGIAGTVKTLPPGVTLFAGAPNAGGIAFQPDGSASAGVFWLQTAHLRQSVTVSWLTGQVTLGQVAMNDQN
jgi:general secretion pathway protein H